MQIHSATHPGIHFKKTGRFDLLDVHGFALIQDGQVGRQLHAFHERAHEWRREVRDIQIRLRVSTQAENF
jgi:hypothetical protein